MSEISVMNDLSPSEYLEGELHCDVRHEYIDGQVYAMAGAGERHNRIALNAAFHLRGAARGGACGVFMNDMKLHIPESNCFYYPDVMVTCNPADAEEYFKQSPCLLIEVLSPSTATQDRREKRLQYQGIDSLRYYLIISSDERRVEVHERGDGGDWRAWVMMEGETLDVRCEGFEAELGLDGVYEDVGLV
ncbi:MAG: Uma2 family endonuclease [Gammaproteobacteria bacterium]